MSTVKKVALIIVALTIIGLGLTFVSNNFNNWSSDWYNWFVNNVRSF